MRDFKKLLGSVITIDEARAVQGDCKNPGIKKSYVTPK